MLEAHNIKETCVNEYISENIFADIRCNDMRGDPHLQTSMAWLSTNKKTVNEIITKHKKKKA